MRDRKQYWADWHQANREKRRAYMKDYNAAHRAERQASEKRIRDARRPLVYLWFDPADGTAFYVGRGTIDRAKAHQYASRRSPWWRPGLSLITMTCEDEWQAMEYEGRWGGYYQPLFNKEGYRHALDSVSGPE